MPWRVALGDAPACRFAAMLEALETFPGCRTILPGVADVAARRLWTFKGTNVAPRSPLVVGTGDAGGHRRAFSKGRTSRRTRRRSRQGPARRTDREGCRGRSQRRRRRRVSSGTGGLDADAVAAAAARRAAATRAAVARCASCEHCSATYGHRGECFAAAGRGLAGTAPSGRMNATTIELRRQGRASGAVRFGTARDPVDLVAALCLAGW